jgi:hypothetical protein
MNAPVSMIGIPASPTLPIGGGPTQEKTMKLITRFELAARSTTELRGLLRQTFDALAASTPKSADRRAVLASLENIQAELGARPDGP